MSCWALETCLTYVTRQRRRCSREKVDHHQPARFLVGACRRSPPGDPSHSSARPRFEKRSSPRPRAWPSPGLGVARSEWTEPPPASVLRWVRPGSERERGKCSDLGHDPRNPAPRLWAVRPYTLGPFQAYSCTLVRPLRGSICEKIRGITRSRRGLGANSTVGSERNKLTLFVPRRPAMEFLVAQSNRARLSSELFLVRARARACTIR